jgi:hypothetical protein
MRQTAGTLVVAVLGAASAFGGSSRVVASWKLTPGVLNRDVTQRTIGSTICVHGWTRTLRPPASYTNRLKVVQMRQYHEPGSPSRYEAGRVATQLKWNQMVLLRTCGPSRAPVPTRSTRSRRR